MPRQSLMAFSSFLPIFDDAIALALGLSRLGRSAPSDGGMQKPGRASSSCLRRRESPRQFGSIVVLRTATAALVWNGDLPRQLQQILFDTADGAAPPKATWSPAAPEEGRQYGAELISARTPALAGRWN